MIQERSILSTQLTDQFHEKAAQLLSSGWYHLGPPRLALNGYWVQTFCRSIPAFPQPAYVMPVEILYNYVGGEDLSRTFDQLYWIYLSWCEKQPAIVGDSPIAEDSEFQLQLDAAVVAGWFSRVGNTYVPVVPPPQPQPAGQP